MILSKKHNYLFVHIWKTGGTSIRTALIKGSYRNPFVAQTHISLDKVKSKATRFARLNNILISKNFSHGMHASFEEIKELVGAKVFSNLYKFAFVRNPFDMRVSLYHYIKKTKRHPQYQVVKNLSFENFVRWEVSNKPHLQYKMIYDKNDKKLANYIGRFENLESDFNQICNKVGIETKLPHINRSNHKKDYRKYYNDQIKRLVRDKYQLDLKAFNYEF